MNKVGPESTRRSITLRDKDRVVAYQEAVRRLVEAVAKAEQGGRPIRNGDAVMIPHELWRGVVLSARRIRPQ